MTNEQIGDITDTSLMEDAMSVMTQNDRKQGKKITATIHTEKEDFNVMKVIHWQVVSDYYKQTGEQFHLTAQLGRGDYLWRVLPFADHLEISITTTWLKKNGEEDFGRPPIEVRFKALLDTTKNPNYSNESMSNMSIKDLNLLAPLEIDFELLDRNEEIFRVLHIDGVFPKVTMDQMLRSVIPAEANRFNVDGKPLIQGMEVDPPDSQDVFKDLIIPSGLLLRDLPGYLQEKTFGVYNAGMGSFFQRVLGKPMMFVFPLYRPERFDEDRQKLVIYAVPAEKFPGYDVTFRKEGKITYIVTTGERKVIDGRKNNQINQGSGFRMMDANAVMKKPIQIEEGKIVAKRSRLNFEMLQEERKDKINYAPMVDTSSNPYLQYSRMAANHVTVISFTWENSDDTVLYPGIPVKYVYMHRGNYVEVKGTLVKAYHRSTLQGNTATDANHRTTSHLTVFVESTSDLPDNNIETAVGEIHK